MGFWIAAAALGAFIATLIMARAAGSSRAAASQIEDPTILLYRRQLTEIDELAARGVLNEEDRRSSFAEAARRLVGTQPEAARATAAVPPWVVLTACGTALLLALGIYLTTGAPTSGDQPFASRLAGWQSADPRTLDAPSMTAVLNAIAKERPNDPRLLMYLTKLQLASGDSPAAAQTLRRLTRLTPNNAEAFSLLGQALIASAPDGRMPEDAETAFRKAASLDPTDVSVRYFIAQATLQHGDTNSGVAALRTLQADLPLDDARRAFLDTQIQQATGAPSSDPAASAMIKGMVAKQAAKLKENPNDPEGWARLVRSYGVLGDAAAQSAAVAQARLALAGRPDALAKVEAEAEAVN